LTALALWPGATRARSGGRFTDNRALELRLNACTEPLAGFSGQGISISYGDPACHDQSVCVEGASWTGQDRRGRLIIAKGGKIFRKNDADRDSLSELLDLNGLMPDLKAEPAWTDEWID
jgi:hypothetical protein